MRAEVSSSLNHGLLEYYAPFSNAAMLDLAVTQGHFLGSWFSGGRRFCLASSYDAICCMHLDVTPGGGEGGGLDVTQVAGCVS